MSKVICWVRSALLHLWAQAWTEIACAACFMNHVFVWGRICWQVIWKSRFINTRTHLVAFIWKPQFCWEKRTLHFRAQPSSNTFQCLRSCEPAWKLWHKTSQKVGIFSTVINKLPTMTNYPRLMAIWTPFVSWLRSNETKVKLVSGTNLCPIPLSPVPCRSFMAVTTRNPNDALMSP